ncbi:hypothetical protein GCM10011410_19100 [Hoyosella rhizosphaerae]|uniref:Uncharacterized protein n=1 Tax=Hoyosella rhizosphaerae TaxID=1755582 RepID=A0A916XE11_9ACTN|nr:hypothetical protein GCM10011410_19100 [Hoyosella rhizosphaerae]
MLCTPRLFGCHTPKNARDIIAPLAGNHAGSRGADKVEIDTVNRRDFH